MNIAFSSSKTIRISVVSTVLLFSLSIGLYYYFKYEPTWDEIKSSVQEAPAWIFLTTLVLLPPLGMPLSIFLFAVGARFGIVGGACAACIAIALHHIIALGISIFLSGDEKPSGTQASLWTKLEEKAGGNASKLLLLWGLLPGLPYVVKLYLPLTMGVSKAPYIQWNTLGHLIGAIIFVSVGSALFTGLTLPIIIIVALAVAASIALKVYRRRVSQNAA